MRASKETARAALTDFELIWAKMRGRKAIDETVQGAAERLREFIRAASRKLPSEETYKRDEERRDSKKT